MVSGTCSGAAPCNRALRAVRRCTSNHASRTRVGKGATLNVGENYRESVTGNSKEVVGKRKVIDAHDEILIRCGKSELRMKSDGSITLNGKKLDVTQSDTIALKAGRIDLN